MISDRELHGKIRKFAADAAHFYVGMSGDAVSNSVSIPETFIQSCCAIDLRKHGLFVCLEVNNKTCKNWFMSFRPAIRSDLQTGHDRL
jgi:hypothetical protein